MLKYLQELSWREITEEVYIPFVRATYYGGK